MKKVLGWKKIKRLPEGEWTKAMRVLKQDKNGTVRVAVGRLLKSVGVPRENYPGLVVKTHRALSEPSEIYFIEIPKKTS